MLAVKKLTNESEIANNEIGCDLTLDDYIQIMYPKADECGYVALAHKTQTKPSNRGHQIDKEKTAEEIYELVLSGKVQEDTPYEFSQRCLRPNELLSYADLSKDCYTSMNTFFIPRRQKGDVRHLNALFVDIDYYNIPGATKESVLEILEFNIKKELIPPPTFIVDSGRGIYFIWKIEDVPGKYVRATRLYMAVQEYIYSLFVDVGADPKAKDVSRILRLPSSNNIKAKRKVKVIEYNEKSMYTLRFFQEYINIFEADTVPEKKRYESKKYKKKTSKKKGNLKHLFNAYTLHVSRMRDLETICYLRNYEMKGYRDSVIFLYYYYNLLVHKDKNIALFNTKELNSKFTEPLMDNEVRSFITSSEVAYQAKEAGLKPSKSGFKEAGYNYKNETLINMFQITDEEQKQLKTIISTREKYDRNNAKRTPRKDGLTPRQKSKQDLIDKVKALGEQGYKQTQIAKELGVTKGTVSKYLKL